MQPTLKKTLKLMLESGNDYLVALKANQAKLHHHVESIVAHCKPCFPAFETHDQQRGRHERRCVTVFEPMGIDTDQWPQVRSVLCLERETTRNGKTTCHRAYYISSLATTPRHWMELVRGHWSIENRLHWTKDVLLHEDQSYGLNTNALLNASVFRTITINVLRLNGFESIKVALRQLANQVQQIFKLLQ